LVGLLRQSVFGRLAGYEDVNDADRLCRDPAMRWAVGDPAITGSAASTSQMGRFETEWLTRPENLIALADLPGRWIDKVHTRRPPRIIVLDMDSSESPTYGEQEGSAYNGHFGCTCIHGPSYTWSHVLSWRNNSADIRGMPIKNLTASATMPPTAAPVTGWSPNSHSR
jgi:hypothetical protein